MSNKRKASKKRHNDVIYRNLQQDRMSRREAWLKASKILGEERRASVEARSKITEDSES